MICANIYLVSIKKYLAKLEDLTAKEILITGGTSGIGLAVVRQLVEKHANVVVLARNVDKFNKVKEDILTDNPNAKLDIIKYDQSDDQSVKEAAKEIILNHPHFDALILNAGIIQKKKPYTYVDGYPLTIKTNLIGLNLLLNELLPNLSGPHRFILQGSLVAGLRTKKIASFKDKKIGAWSQYFISKAGVEALFYHYSQSESPFEFILIEPGIAITGIVREFPKIIRFLANLVSRVISHTADKAALTALVALQSTTTKNSFIVPRGLFAWRGYPKFKKFPSKRKREYLVDLLNKS